MDDVDAVQAQIAHNMLQSGDWVTARLDGVKYLEKSPLKYWMMAISFAIPDGGEFPVRLLGAGRTERGAGPGTQHGAQRGLQLQRRTPPEPPSSARSPREITAAC